MKPALTLLLLLVACASAGPRPAAEESSSDRANARADEQRAEELERTLSGLSAAEVPPDCPRVCGLVEQICELSQRICGISGRHPDDPDLAARCAAGEQRCRRSRDRVPPDCSCRAR
jgi:hypothetical protein